MRPFLPLLLSAALLALPVAHAGTPLPDAPHIIVTGTGEVSAKPDSARVAFQFRSNDARPLPAKQRVDEAVNRLLAGMPAFGVGSDDVRASDLEAGEDVDYDDDGERIMRGYYASREVTATLRDLERLNAFLDDGLAAGAVAISSVEFESSRADALRQQAKAEAVEDAKREAGEMARAFGAKRGALYSVNSVTSRFADGYGTTELDSIVVSGSRIDAQPGRYIQPTVEYRASVSAVFELQR